MKHRVGVTVALSMAILLESGCALQPWFRGLFEKPEAKLDAQLVDVEKTVDQHSGLESRVAGAAALAREVRDRADVAVARTDTLDRRQTPAARAARPAARTRSLFGMVHVRFGLDRADLDDKAEKALVNVVKELRQNPGLTLDLEGTTRALSGGFDGVLHFAARCPNFMLAAAPSIRRSRTGPIARFRPRAVGDPSP